MWLMWMMMVHHPCWHIPCSVVIVVVERMELVVVVVVAVVMTVVVVVVEMVTWGTSLPWCWMAIGRG